MRPKGKVKERFIGEVFGNWVVLEFAPMRGTNYMVKAICSCGKTKTVFLANLVRGQSKSCGECEGRGGKDFRR